MNYKKITQELKEVTLDITAFRCGLHREEYINSFAHLCMWTSYLQLVLKSISEYKGLDISVIVYLHNESVQTAEKINSIIRSITPITERK